MAPNDTTPTGPTADSTTDSGEGTLFEGSSTSGPYAAESLPDAPAASAGPAPRKRGARRATKQAAAAIEPAHGSAPPEPSTHSEGAAASGPASSPAESDATAVAAEATSGATRTPRKRAARKTAAAPRSRTSRRAAAAETSDALESVELTEAATTTPSARAEQPAVDPAVVVRAGADLEHAAVVDESADVDQTTEVEETAEVDQAADVDDAGEPTGADLDADTPETEPAPPVVPSFSVLFQAPDPTAALATPSRRRRAQAPATVVEPTEPSDEGEEPVLEAVEDVETAEPEGDETGPRRSRRRRGGKGRRGRGPAEEGESDEADSDEVDADELEGSEHRRPSQEDGPTAGEAEDESAEEGNDEGTTSRRRRRRRRAGSTSGEGADEAPNVSTRVRQPRTQSDEPVGVKGSTRLEAKKQRRREGREAGRRRTVITEAEFLARREAVDRVMVVRNKEGRTQMGVLEDGVLVEHYIDQATSVSMAGNIYLGRVQNVLPSMEAAFVDIGKGRNAVLYAGEVNWDAAGLDSNQPKRIENALSSGQSVLVQVTKDPIGHKGARLTSQISLPGRYLVYVPNSSMTGISRKLPDTERARLKKILRDVVPESAGVIVRTAAEGASEEELRADVERLTRTWEDIQSRAEEASTPRAGKSKGKKKNGGSGSAATGTAPLLLHGEPDLTVRVIRDVFNEDFKELIVSGEQAWNEIHPYITSVAPDLAERVTRWTSEEDLFTTHRVDEQLAKAMDRKVWLPSGGSLVIDRTEAMTVVDVNTGKFVGSGGNLEETVTKNNLEAAEEIVRQLRLRDIGGIIVIDFIDMVLESNRDLVVRRLLECLGRDRTKHQVAEVTSLGLVQMTRKRVGSGLIEVFSETCEHCNGRGFIIHSEPVDKGSSSSEDDQGGGRSGRRGRRGASSSSSTGGGQANGTSQEPARHSGPTAAQIAAAAHAAAVKSAGAMGDEVDLEGGHQGFPEDSGPWEGQDQALAGQHAGAEDVELESDVDDPAHAQATPEAAPASAVPTASDGAIDGAIDRAPDTVLETAPAATPDRPDAVPDGAPRPRRRRGRVVAPAGPPPTTSTEG